jgi:hypothetical protein
MPQRKQPMKLQISTYTQYWNPTGVSAGDYVTMPAQDGVRSHQQSDPTQGLSRQALEQRGEERPVDGVEPDLLSVQLSFQDADLMAQGQDLDVLLAVAQRQ